MIPVNTVCRIEGAETCLQFSGGSIWEVSIDVPAKGGMMMSTKLVVKWIISLLSIGVIFAGCSSSDSASSTPDTVTYSLDGAPEVTISGNPDASTCAFGTFLNDPSSPRALISTFSNSDAFGLSFPGQVAGTYPTGSGFGTLDSTDFAADGTIIVTEFGIVGGLIVGTFDLTISNGSLLSQSFTGNFSVTRELDDELDTADVDCQ